MASIESYTKKGIDAELNKIKLYVDNTVSSISVSLVEDPPGSGLYAITAGGTDPT